MLVLRNHCLPRPTLGSQVPKLETGFISARRPTVTQAPSTHAVLCGAHTRTCAEETSEELSVYRAQQITESEVTDKS